MTIMEAELRFHAMKMLIQEMESIKNHYRGIFNEIMDNPKLKMVLTKEEKRMICEYYDWIVGVKNDNATK